MSRIFVYPDVDNKEQLEDLICRLAWYFRPFLDQIAAFNIVCESSNLANLAITGSFDESLWESIPSVKAKVVPCTSYRFLEEIQSFEPAQDLILLRDESAEAGAPKVVRSAIESAKKKSAFWRVDPHRTRLEGSYYLHAGWNKFADKQAIIALNKRKFEDLAESLGRFSKAYVYGTGPSLSEFAENHDFGDGISIISNSIVKNDEILEKTDPKIIVAADPLYHAGCSNYAGEFRASLIQALRKTGAHFLCPIRDYLIYKSAFPEELIPRLIGVPFHKEAKPTTSLLDSFHLKQYPNILTLMLLPVASTFADSISIVGCDGRRITDDAFFWAHDKKAQFNDRMEDIRKVHPAFFAINYNDYYVNHCRDLEEMLAAFEALGKSIVTETPSFIPALHAREANFRRQPAITAGTAAPATMVIVDPDSKDTEGDSLHYDRKFAATCRHIGFRTALIARRELDPALDPEHVQHTSRVLTHHSWNYGNNANPATKERALASFAMEMDQAMVDLEASFPDGLICLYMYLGCVEVAEILEHLLVYRHRFRAFINLFWSYNFDHRNREYRDLWLPALRRMNDSGRIFLSHSTPQIAAQYRHDWDLDIPMIPHSSITFGDAEAHHLSHVPQPAEASATIRVLFPGGPRNEEGFILSTEAAELLSKAPGIKVVLRASIAATRAEPGKDFGQELVEAFDRIDKDGMESIDAGLRDDAFIDMIGSCDIVVIPFLPEAFSRRTSDILVDALILGKAVVVIEGTWLGDIVKQEGIGLCAAPTAQALAAAVTDLAETLGAVTANIARVRSRYLTQNSWSALVVKIAEKLNNSIDTAGAAVSAPKPALDAVFDRVISINPDAESFFGHFLNYETRLGRAMRKRAVQHLIAGPVDGEADVYAAHPEMERVFSVRTNKLYAKRGGETVPDLDRFGDELDRYLYRLAPRTKTLLFMYCGSLEIAEIVSRLAEKYSSCTFAISLYYLSWLDLTAPGLRAYWKPRLMAMAQHPRIRLIAPSLELAETLQAHFGVSPEILPHPSTSFHDVEMGTLQTKTTGPGDTGMTVVFPGNQRGGKGYELTRDAIKALLAADIEGLKLRVRRPPDDSYSKPRCEFFESIRDRVEILDSYLDEASFRALLQSADIVALPYTPDRFADRTSGLLIDSLLIGIPCVVIRGTWLERMVNAYGFGIATNQDGKSMAEGILEAMRRFQPLKDAALAGRARYLERNSWDALAGFLTKISPPKAAPAPAAALDAAPVAVARDHGTAAPAARKRRLLIIGNGPSTRVLADAGFDRLPTDMDTWGTTAAYRYFERVGWWPTYFALADRKVAFHHRENFARLLDDPNVTTKKFFLSWKVSDSPRMELIPHSSTGSFSLRKALELGYKEIYLIGMEGAYVEEILESRPLSPEEIAERGFGVLNLTPVESKLRIIDSTPTFNPNYFFSGYQQAGDVYSLPQANAHKANWRNVADVAKKYEAIIYNLSAISKIDVFEKKNVYDVFPFIDKDCWKDFINPLEPVIFGPYKRQQSAHWDETYAIAEFFLSQQTGTERARTMIDVGAHHGSALRPFLDLGWSIFAFEPDAKNRANLLERLQKHKNNMLVTLDTRCVSNKSNTGVSFFTSDQSTGISGLSAFHETHKESQKVDVTTLTEFFQDQRMPAIDFLKIDTEGHDLFVLEGYPWERSQPAVIECEFEDAKTVPLGYTFHNLANYLVKKGYRVFVSEWHPIIRYGVRHDWRALMRYPCDLADPKGWGNLLAFRDPIDEKALVVAVNKVLKFPAATSTNVLESTTTTPPPVDRESAGENSPRASLQRFAEAALNDPSEDGKSASLLLRSCATALLLHPNATLALLEEDSKFAQVMTASLNALPEEDPLKQHCTKVIAVAKAKTESF